MHACVFSRMALFRSFASISTHTVGACVYAMLLVWMDVCVVECMVFWLIFPSIN